MLARLALGDVPDWILAVTSLFVAVGGLYAYFSRRRHEAFTDATRVRVSLGPVLGDLGPPPTTNMLVTVYNNSSRDIHNVVCVVTGHSRSETGRHPFGSISVAQEMRKPQVPTQDDWDGASRERVFGSTVTAFWNDSDGRKWSKDNWGTLRSGREARLPGAPTSNKQ